MRKARRCRDGWILAVVISLLTFATSPAKGEEFFETVKRLRLEGRFNDAVAVLEETLRDPGLPEEVLRTAYVQLVFTKLHDPECADADDIVREALTRFPDLEADAREVPPAVTALFDKIRAEMYGSLEVSSEPQNCDVYLNGVHAGKSPLTIRYVRIGNHELTATKRGYHDGSAAVDVEGGRESQSLLVLTRRDEFKVFGRLRIGGELSISRVSVDYGSLPQPGSRTGVARVAGYPIEQGAAVRFGAGAIVEMQIVPRLNFCSGLRFVRLGNEAFYVGGDLQSGVYRMYNDYLVLPLGLKLFLAGEPRFFVGVALETEFLLSAKIQFAQLSRSLDDDLDPLNFSGSLGAGFEFPLARHFLFIAVHMSAAIGEATTSRPTALGWSTREVRFSGGFIY